MAQQKSETIKIREGYGFLAFYGTIGCIFAYFDNDVFRNLLAPVFAVVFAAVGIRLGVLRWKEIRNDASPDSASVA